jgi:hypothetical protein
MNFQEMATTASRLANASQFGVCCTVEGDDFLIWTVIKHKKIIMHRLYAPCTSSDRLEAHIVGFAKNIM